MKYDDIHPVMRSALGAHEAFRKLHFAASDIYVHFGSAPNAPAKHTGVFVTLRLPVEGKRVKSYSVHVGFWERGQKNAERFVHGWRDVVKAVKHGHISEDDLDRCWQESPPKRDPTGFVAGLVLQSMLPAKRPMDAQDGSTTLDVGFDAPCVFCAQTITIGTVRETQNMYLAHREPACAKYLALSADEFLKQTNDTLAEARRKARN